MRDLPGQTFMPFAGTVGAADKPVARSVQGGCNGGAYDAQVALLALPAKATVTPPEAAKALGISSRQVRYLVEDGTLLAINAGREVASGDDRERRRTPWRVVVRRVADLRGAEFDRFMTLEEFIQRRTNMES
jgi:hypothetical protein